MQTKNMRLLKASVLCLSVFLLKQTAGHAGLGDEMQDPNFKADRSYYTGVPLMPDQDDKIRALFQQATASAVMKPSRETGEDEVHEVGDYPLNDQDQLVMSDQQALGHLQGLADQSVSEDVVREAVKVVQKVLPSLSGNKQAGVQEWIDVIQQGLDNGEYAEDAEKAASQFGDVTGLMKVLLIKIFS